MATVKKVKKAQFGAPIRKGGSRGGGSCVATTSAADRADRREGRQAERDYNKLMRQNKRDERKAERAERKAPPAKHGKSVMKAQDGKKVVLTEMGKKTTRAAINKRTDEMAKSLDRASVFGKNYIAPSDTTKKAVKKLVSKKKMGGVVKAQKGKKITPTADSTYFFEKRADKYDKAAGRLIRAGANYETFMRTKKVADQARDDAYRQGFKATPGYDANGFPIKKKAVNKPVPKKKMMNGGKAKKMMNGGKCKYGC